MPTMYQGRGFSVEVETIRFPNGTEHQQETVRHPPSVVLVPMQDAGHVVMIRQYRASVGREIWELPAGGIRPGETAEAAAARECEEEIRLVPNTIERIRALYPSPGFCDEEMVFFRVSDLRQPPANSTNKPDEDEDIHVQVFTIADAKKLDIVDLKTAYGLTLI
jgi:8-oxo-dGTP pyrophosphatase MutT (NUDIX family)